MSKSLEINIDMELEEARKGAYEPACSSYPAYWATRSARSASGSASRLVRAAAHSAACSTRLASWLTDLSDLTEYNKQRLIQVEMIKDIL